jgi:hypothetical protein
MTPIEEVKRPSMTKETIVAKILRRVLPVFLPEAEGLGWFCCASFWPLGIDAADARRGAVSEVGCGSDMLTLTGKCLAGDAL